MADEGRNLWSDFLWTVLLLRLHKGATVGISSGAYVMWQLCYAYIFSMSTDFWCLFSPFSATVLVYGPLYHVLGSVFKADIPVSQQMDSIYLCVSTLFHSPGELVLLW